MMGPCSLFARTWCLTGKGIFVEGKFLLTAGEGRDALEFSLQNSEMLSAETKKTPKGQSLLP